MPAAALESLSLLCGCTHTKDACDPFGAAVWDAMDKLDGLARQVYCKEHGLAPIIAATFKPLQEVIPPGPARPAQPPRKDVIKVPIYYEGERREMEMLKDFKRTAANPKHHGIRGMVIDEALEAHGIDWRALTDAQDVQEVWTIEKYEDGLRVTRI